MHSQKIYFNILPLDTVKREILFENYIKMEYYTKPN